MPRREASLPSRRPFRALSGPPPFVVPRCGPARSDSGNLGHRSHSAAPVGRQPRAGSAGRLF
eukprot:4746958-Alexandrium_andersonii.AAC.1